MRSGPARSTIRFILFGLALLNFTSANTLGQAVSNGISKEKLIALRNAGVNDSVLVQQIQKDGIAFDMNADTTLELKNAGFSNDVLQALLQASRKAPPASAQTSQNDSVAALYKAGRFPELADHLKATLRANPSDYRTHALLIMTLLKMKEKDSAQSEFQTLSTHEQDPAAVPYVKQVRALLDTLAKTQEAKDKLLAALKEYRTTDAMAVVDELPASPTQREILKLNLDVYEAKFDQARDRFSKIQFERFAEKERSTKIQDSIATSEAQYQKLMSRVDVYLYSVLAPVSCRFPITEAVHYRCARCPELASLSAREYVEYVNNLTQIAPLNTDIVDLGFHAELLIGDYDKLEQMGDRLLKLGHSIRIPFYSSDRFFRVVIDPKRQHIYTESDPHRFEALSTKWLMAMVPFDLPYDQIKEISQARGHYDDGTLLGKNPYALKLGPGGGIAPNYSLMNILYCSAGQQAELTATKNLGQYILHVIGGNSVKADLLDPNKVKGGSSGWTTAALMLGGALTAMGGSSPLNQMAMQGLQVQQAQQMATYQAQQAAWESFSAARDTFNFVEADAFSGLEQLLGVLN